MATAREDLVTGEDTLARLKEMVETLERNQQSINVTVAAPPNRTLREFTGRSCELHDWMEDARNRLLSVPAAERLPFLIAHLEGPAREEVSYAPEEEKDSVDNIFTLLLSTFGETPSNAQLKSELYERRQRNRESVREFSPAMLEISEGISEAIRLEEDGMGNSYQNACVRGIQEPHHTRGDSSPLDRIAAQLQLLATTQSEIVSLLRSQQQAPVGVGEP